jgi:armadillo repeat-containing protein 7
MFSTPQSLQRRTGRFGVGRFAYLKQLCDEYKSESTSSEKREQVLANLGNFAYDPINYEYFRRLNVIDVFLNVLNDCYMNEKERESASKLKLVEYALGAVCNMCPDPTSRDYMLGRDLIKMVINCLSLKMAQAELTLNALAILVQLGADSECDIIELLSKDSYAVQLVEDQKFHLDKRVANLATLFITDFVSQFQKCK